MNILIIVFGVLYVLIGTIVAKFTKLKPLMIIEVPVAFIVKSHIYTFVVLICFVIFSVLILIKDFSFLNFILIVAIRQIPPYLGEKLAFNHYRKKMKEFFEDPETSKDNKEWVLSQSKISNKELRSLLKTLKF